MPFSSISLLCLLAASTHAKTTQPPPPATTTFDENFISQPYFVDKTLLLRELFKNDQGPDYNYLSYPSKFGKTLALQMIKNFAQIEVVERQEYLNWTQTKAYQLFKNLKIAQHRDVLEKHMARYVVIYVDLKHDVEEPINDENIILALNQVIRKCYKEYHWVIKIAKNLARNVPKHESIMDKGLQGALDKVEIREGIQFLAQLLKDFFNTKVLLLIDDFDYFYNRAFAGGRLHIERYRKIINLIMKKTFTYGNLYISHAVIFGSSGLNYNFSSYNYPETGHYELSNWMFLADHRFGAFIGFNEYEINVLCQRYRCTEEEITQLKVWYDGYLTRKLGQEHEDNGEMKQTSWADFQSFGSEQRSIYNPYSVVEYFSGRQQSPFNASFGPIWPQTQDPLFIYNFLRVPEFRNRFVELFKYDGIEMPRDRDQIPQIFHEFTTSDTYVDEKIILENADIAMVGFFFDLGYLSYARDLYYVAKIPNREVHSILSDILVQFYQNRTFPVEEIRQCFDQAISAATWDDASNVAAKAQQVLSKAFRMISIPYYYRPQPPLTTAQPLYRQLLPRGLEFHNIVFAGALLTSLKRPNTVVNVTEIGEYRERDDILVHDRANNEAVIIRFRNQTDLEKKIPVPFRKALQPRKNVTKIKFLVLKINKNNQLEAMVQVYN